MCHVHTTSIVSLPTAALSINMGSRPCLHAPAHYACLTAAAALSPDEVTAETQLFRACAAGDTTAVEYLVGELLAAAGVQHAEQQAPDAWGGTPFFKACENGHLAVVRFLAAEIGQARYPECGPSWNRQPGGFVLSRPNVAGWTPFNVACKNGHVDVARFLAQHASRRALRMHQPDNTGCSPVFCATRGGHVAVVLLLLELGLDPNQPDQMGQTPLQLVEARNSSSNLGRRAAQIVHCLQTASEQMPVLRAEQRLALAKMLVFGRLDHASCLEDEDVGRLAAATLAKVQSAEVPCFGRWLRGSLGSAGQLLLAHPLGVPKIWGYDPVSW